MNPVSFHFYRRTDCLSEDGKTLDYSRLATLAPMASLKARTEIVLANHIEHFAFEISARHQDLEGLLLAAQLKFEGADKLQQPYLEVRHEGVLVESRKIPLATLDMNPFMEVIARKNPGVDLDLVYTMTWSDQPADSSAGSGGETCS